MLTPSPSRLWGAALVVLAVVAAWRCGADKKKSEGGAPPPTATQQEGTPTPPELPSEWDGASDFTGSAFEVIDE